MIVTIQLPGSLAQGDLISRLGDVATIKLDGQLLTGPVVPRVEGGLQAQADGFGGGDTGDTTEGPSAAKIRGVQE